MISIRLQGFNLVFATYTHVSSELCVFFWILKSDYLKEHRKIQDLLHIVVIWGCDLLQNMYICFNLIFFFKNELCF